MRRANLVRLIVSTAIVQMGWTAPASGGQPTTSVAGQAAQFADGAFGTSAGDLRLLLERSGDALIMTMGSGRYEYSRQADGSFQYQSFNLRIVDPDTIETWATGKTPTRYIRSGTPKDWSGAATRQNLALAADYEAKIAALQAEQAAQEEAERERDRVADQQMLANMQGELAATVASGGGSGAVAYFPQTSRPGASAPLQDLQQMAEEAHKQAEVSRRRLERTIAEASAKPGRESAGSSGSNGAIIVGSGDANVKPSDPVSSPAPAQTAAPSAYYWYCYGQKKAPDPGKSDRIVSIYLGTVTSSRQDINGATELFRQHTSSDQARDMENRGAWCAPAGSSAEANERLQFYRSRDSRWPQVNVNLTM